MPIVRIENAGELTKEQKKELIQKMTKIVVDVTKKNEKYVYVKIEEIPRENFGIAGEPLG